MLRAVVVILLQMGESYYSLGQGTNWIIAVSAPLACSMSFLLDRDTTMRKKSLVALTLLCFVSALFYVMAFPQLWLLGMLIMSSVALGRFFPDSKPRTKSRRLVLAAIGVASALLISFLPLFIGPEKITLSSGSVVWKPYYTSEEFRRTELKCTESAAEMRLFGYRKSWTFSRLEPALGSFSLSTQDDYGGPHGLIRGADLAKRIIEWSGVKPEIRQN